MAAYELLQVRKWFTPTTTISQVFEGVGAFRQFECFFLEDLTRAPLERKVPGQTAIPFGRYQIRLTHSPKFNRILPIVFNVETPDGRLLVRSANGDEWEGIRIHVGNGPEDTQGCLLPGRIRQPDNLRVLQSTIAFDALNAKLEAAKKRGDEMWLTIQQAA